MARAVNDVECSSGPDKEKSGPHAGGGGVLTEIPTFSSVALSSL